MNFAIITLVLATITATVTAGGNKQTCDECHSRIQGCLYNCLGSASCSTYCECELSWSDRFCTDTCNYRCQWSNRDEMMEALKHIPQ